MTTSLSTFPYDAGSTLADRFRAWAGDNTHLYGHAARAMAADWERGGPVRVVCRGYEDAPSGSVVHLRLLAGVFRLVLNGRSEELRPFYPCLGGTADPAHAWPRLREVIAGHGEELHAALQIAPQTNDVGRSAALLVGLLDVLGASGHRRIRLLELGASAGLNLLLDRFAIHGPGWRFGPADSAVQLRDAVRGPASGSIELVPIMVEDRGGCDLHPVDPSTEDGRLLLTSFVWPFDVHRHVRLAEALTVVDQVGPVPVDRASAAEWLAEQLRRPPEAEVLPVVWNSITQQYWPAAEVSRVAELLDGYGAAAPLARVAMEFRPDSPGYEQPEVRTWYWPGDGSAPVHRLVARAHDHGVPVVVNPRALFG